MPLSPWSPLRLAALLIGTTALLPSSHAARPGAAVDGAAGVRGDPLLPSEASGVLSAAPDAPSSARYGLDLLSGERISVNLWFSLHAEGERTPEPPLGMLRLRIVAPDGREQSSPLCVTERPEERGYDLIKICRPWSFTAGPPGRYTFLLEDRTVNRHAVRWSLLSRRDFPRGSPASG